MYIATSNDFAQAGAVWQPRILAMTNNPEEMGVVLQPWCDGAPKHANIVHACLNAAYNAAWASLDPCRWVSEVVLDDEGTTVYIEYIHALPYVVSACELLTKPSVRQRKN